MGRGRRSDPNHFQKVTNIVFLFHSVPSLNLCSPWGDCRLKGVGGASVMAWVPGMASRVAGVTRLILGLIPVSTLDSSQPTPSSCLALPGPAPASRIAEPPANSQQGYTVHPGGSVGEHRQGSGIRQTTGPLLVRDLLGGRTRSGRATGSGKKGLCEHGFAG